MSVSRTPIPLRCLLVRRLSLVRPRLRSPGGTARGADRRAEAGSFVSATWANNTLELRTNTGEGYQYQHVTRPLAVRFVREPKEEMLKGYRKHKTASLGRGATPSPLSPPATPTDRRPWGP